MYSILFQDSILLFVTQLFFSIVFKVLAVSIAVSIKAQNAHS